MSSDAATIREFLARATRRRALLLAVEGAAIGLIVAAVMYLSGWPPRAHHADSLLVTVALVAAGIIHRIVTLGSRHIAQQVEQRAPHCHNLLVTAAELTAPERTVTSPYIHALIMERAAALVETLRLSKLFPARYSLVAMLAAALLWVGAVMGAGLAIPTAAPLPVAARNLGVIDRIQLTITPPPYAGRTVEAFDDPSRVELLAGSHVHLTVHARAEAVALETLNGRQLLRATSPGTFAGDVTPEADGFIALEPARVDGSAGLRHLIGVSVLADAPPRVRLTAPARDLRFDDGAHSLDLAVSADDDIGLATLKLRYTKVSGSGERFSFLEGEIPVVVTRTTSREWTGRATWRLAALGLEPGDVVVYRAVASDARPGSRPVESDAWIVEITAPGGIAAAGFDVDPEQQRYALSQQMVILKTERLLAKKNAISAEAFADSAAQLAAEQRKVRAEFVFMMGGEVADDQGQEISMTDLNEEGEAANESELAAGRMVNAGRAAIVRGIRYMSRAATGLTTLEVTTALEDEKKALTEIEKAFSHSRIILRALTQRERLDPTRRLTGQLGEAASSTRPVPARAGSARSVALRGILAELATLAGTGDSAPANVRDGSALAERLLRVDPASKELQQVASRLARLNRISRDSALAVLNGAATAITELLGPDLPTAPRDPATVELRQLRGAVASGGNSPLHP